MDADPAERTPDKIEGGYFIVARKILNSGIMEKPSLFAKLWIWMLEKANFKNANGLKRGQLKTSIDEMREAMAHYVGYRKIKPSRKEIRSIYEFLTKGHMAGTTKVTHGMIITICNYDYYQNIKNYEGHNESFTKGQVGAQYKGKERERKNNIRKINLSLSQLPKVATRKTKSDSEKFLPDSLEVEISTRLLTNIRKNNPEFKAPSLQLWAGHIDKMLRIDKRNPEKVCAVVDWVQQDSFWKANVLSTKKLREQFDQLWMKMNGNGRGGKPGQNATDDLVQKWIENQSEEETWKKPTNESSEKPSPKLP